LGNNIAQVKKKTSKKAIIMANMRVVFRNNQLVKIKTW
jgi:hypothetical protein